MKENISESLTFDDVSMLMNEKGSFTEKITYPLLKIQNILNF